MTESKKEIVVSSQEKVLIKHLFHRVYEFLDEIQENYKDKIILLVTHEGITKVMNCYFNGIPEDGNLQKLGLKNCEVKEYLL